MSRHVGECSEDGCDRKCRGEKCLEHRSAGGPTFAESVSEALQYKEDD